MSAVNAHPCALLAVEHQQTALYARTYSQRYQVVAHQATIPLSVIVLNIKVATVLARTVTVPVQLVMEEVAMNAHLA
jgi:hypothetical protein